MSVLTQLQAVSRQILTGGTGIGGSVTIDDMAGHVWSGKGIYFHFERAENAGEAIPLMELLSGIEVIIADVQTVFPAATYPNGPRLNWKVTAADMSGNAVVGYISDCSPNYDLGRYSLRLRK